MDSPSRGSRSGYSLALSSYGPGPSPVMRKRPSSSVWPVHHVVEPPNGERVVLVPLRRRLGDHHSASGHGAAVRPLHHALDVVALLHDELEAVSVVAVDEALEVQALVDVTLGRRPQRRLARPRLRARRNDRRRPPRSGRNPSTNGPKLGSGGAASCPARARRRKSITVPSSRAPRVSSSSTCTSFPGAGLKFERRSLVSHSGLHSTS